MFSTTFFTHDDKGVFNGIVKARGLLTMSEDHKSYDGTVERVVMDTSGNVLQVISGIKGPQRESRSWSAIQPGPIGPPTRRRKKLGRLGSQLAPAVLRRLSCDAVDVFVSTSAERDALIRPYSGPSRAL